MAETRDPPGLLPLVPIDEAMAVKAGFGLESTVVTLRKLDARDKATKIMQYGARFFFWWFATTDPALSQRAFKLYKTTQRSRKAFRMLKILDEAYKLRQVLRAARSKDGHATGRTGFLGYTDALLSIRCLVMGCFWTFDNLNYLTVTDTVNFGVERAQKGFSRSWSVGSALCILLGIDSLRKTEKKRRETASEYKAEVGRRTKAPGLVLGLARGMGEGGQQEARLREALTRANADHFKSWLMILKGVLDMTCAVNITGMNLPKRLLGRKLNDGVIGAAGCASALCVLYNSWPAAKQQQQESHTEQASSPTTLVANGNGSAVGAPVVSNGSMRH